MKKRQTIREWPFYNGGYMSGEQLFMILLMKRRRELENMFREKSSGRINKEDLMGEYRNFLAESITGLTDIEKRTLMQIEEASKTRFGIGEAVLLFTDWEFRAGSCAGSTDCPLVVLGDGTKKELCFFGGFDKEELKRMIRASALLMAGKEITMSEPLIMNGTMYAVRPPQDDWGIKIYGRRRDEKDSFCGYSE